MNFLTQNFSENENENHADEKSGLLSSTPHTCVADDTNSETSSQTSQTHTETCAKLDEASVERQLLLKSVRDQDRHDQTVDTNNTSHNDGDNV